MFLQDRIKCFSLLGYRLKSLSDDDLESLGASAQNQNSWFTKKSVREALSGIVLFLDYGSLERWTSQYDLESIVPKKIGVIAAGNIPLVGFHDVLAVLISGHELMLKASSDDTVLMNFIRKHLIEIDPGFKDKFQMVERLNAADAYIATGSDNTARYFKFYFKDKPNIIRTNRTSVAVLTGHETDRQIMDLGRDIFQYYGLGCRNVSKLYVPKDFDFSKVLSRLQEYESVAAHHKYNNNYDYNKSIYLINGEPHLDNGFLLLRESTQLVSPISVLYYETYIDHDDLLKKLKVNKKKIQCVVGEGYVPFGAAQCPTVMDYADGVDTLDFLQKL